MLVDHRQPGEHSVSSAVKSDRLTIDPDLTFVRVVEPEQDVHQGRFAGAVLAQQSVNLAATNRELDAVIGHDTGEPLDDPPHLDCGRGAVAVLDCHDHPISIPPLSSRGAGYPRSGWRLRV